MAADSADIQPVCQIHPLMPMECMEMHGVEKETRLGSQDLHSWNQCPRSSNWCMKSHKQSFWHMEMEQQIQSPVRPLVHLVPSTWSFKSSSTVRKAVSKTCSRKRSSDARSVPRCTCHDRSLGVVF